MHDCFMRVALLSDVFPLPLKKQAAPKAKKRGAGFVREKPGMKPWEKKSQG